MRLQKNCWRKKFYSLPGFELRSSGTETAGLWTTFIEQVQDPFSGLVTKNFETQISMKSFTTDTHGLKETSISPACPQRGSRTRWSWAGSACPSRVASTGRPSCWQRTWRSLRRWCHSRNRDTRTRCCCPKVPDARSEIENMFRFKMCHRNFCQNWSYPFALWGMPQGSVPW